MRWITPMCFLLFSSLMLSLAQQQSSTTAPRNTAPMLPAGTRIRVKLDSTFRTNVARPGDSLEATVIKHVNRNGIVVLPAGTLIRGEVKEARGANQNNKIEPNLLLAFNQIVLPDGRVLHASASIADAGRKKHVDSTGLLTQPELTSRKKLAMIAIFSATGAAAGMPNGGKGAGIGAAAGAGFGGLAVLLESRRYSDFELRKGGKLWLRLNSELIANVPDRMMEQGAIRQ
jgi:hypothetical protein